MTLSEKEKAFLETALGEAMKEVSTIISVEEVKEAQEYLAVGGIRIGAAFLVGCHGLIRSLK